MERVNSEIKPDERVKHSQSASFHSDMNDGDIKGTLFFTLVIAVLTSSEEIRSWLFSEPFGVLRIVLYLALSVLLYCTLKTARVLYDYISYLSFKNLKKRHAKERSLLRDLR